MMNSITIMQGDAYPLSVSFETADGSPLPAADIREIEVMLGALRKSYLQGDGSYDETTGVYTFRVTQEETFLLNPGTHDVHVRVLSYEGYVIGEDAGDLLVRAARSKVVL